MVMSILLLIACLVVGVLLVGLVVGIVVIINSGDRDRVSTARQGWINRRSQKDQEE